MAKNNNIPTLGLFNKIILDGLGLWDSSEIEFEVPATEKERQAALKKAFDENLLENGCYGPRESVTKSIEEYAPKSQVLPRKSRTVQSFVTHFSKSDFYNHHELDELDPYINVLIEERFNDDEISQYVVQTRKLLIEHYKEFLREASICENSGNEAFGYFLSHIAVDSIMKSSFSFFKESISSDDFNYFVSSFSGSGGNVNDWPLKACLTELLKEADVSAYKLDQFHNSRINSPNKSDMEVWASLSSKVDVSKKSKQIVERFNKNNKMKWHKVLNQFSPLTAILSASNNPSTVKMKCITAFFIHNVARECEKISPDKGITSELMGKIYSRITIQKLSFLNEGRSIKRETLSYQLEKLYILTNAGDERFDQGAIEDYLLSVEIEYKKYLSEIKSQNFYLDLPLPIVFSEFWFINKDGSQYAEIRNTILSNVASDFQDVAWVKSWCLARKMLLSGDRESALQYFKSALVEAKYVSGPYFLLLYVDICAFCKMQYRSFSEKNEVAIFDRFYEELGNSAAKYCTLIGYSPTSKRNPETLMPSSENGAKNLGIVKYIDITSKYMSEISPENICID
ncbi:MAG: hypothetical protein HRU20_14930 [Pseudomonadales bacterium]|nr:hypothetical protein [Pseudomonadales bacterium]